MRPLFASALAVPFLDTGLLLSPLMGQNLLLVLLETDEVEVEIFDAILLEEVLADETGEIDAGLGEGAVFIEGGVVVDRAEAAPVVAHIKRLLGLIASKRVVQRVRDVPGASASRVLPCCRVIVCRRHSTLEHSICSSCGRDFTVLDLDIVVRV